MNPLPSTKRILAFQSPAYLSLDKNRVRIRRKDQIDAFVPVEDIAVVLLESVELTITTGLLASLAKSEAAVIVCDDKHLPIAAYVPFASHHQHTRILAGQIAASDPTKKRIWQQVVQAKIANQAKLLTTRPKSSATTRVVKRLTGMVKDVKSGDTGNAEGVAAACYFEAAFGQTFIRDSDGADLTNAMLNYGYSLIRAATCRAICAAGLHPALGVFHHNRYDPYALADDAMEPLRPLVDLYVLGVDSSPETELTPEIKRLLHPILTATVSIGGERLPLLPALERYAANLRRCILGEAKRLLCPSDLLPSQDAVARFKKRGVE